MHALIYALLPPLTIVKIKSKQSNNRGERQLGKHFYNHLNLMCCLWHNVAMQSISLPPSCAMIARWGSPGRDMVGVGVWCVVCVQQCRVGLWDGHGLIKRAGWVAQDEVARCRDGGGSLEKQVVATGRVAGRFCHRQIHCLTEQASATTRAPCADPNSLLASGWRNSHSIVKSTKRPESRSSDV